MAEETVDPSLLEQTKNQIRKLVQEIAELAESDITPVEFQEAFLARVVAAVAATGGALWMLDGRGTLKLTHQVDFKNSGLLDGRVRTQPHDGLLGCMLQTSQAQVIPPGATVEGVPGAGNPTPYSLIIAPLVLDKQVIGLVEVLMDPTRRAAGQKSTLRFVSDLSDLAIKFLKNRQMRQVLQQQQLWGQLEGFAQSIHSSLNLKETAYAVVNDGKRLVNCDRLSVALKIAGRVAVEAISGQEVVEQRSNLIRELNRLCKVVMQSGEDLIYTGDTESFPAEIRDALEIYVDESGAKGLAICLLHKPEADPTKEKQVFGCVIAEQMGDDHPIPDVQPKLEVIAKHTNTALWNAQEYDRIFLLPALKTIGSPLRFFRGRTLAKVLAVVGLLLATVLAMALVPWTLTVQGDGSLLPEERTTIYAPVAGIVKTIHIEHAQEVKKGQVLLELDNPELKKERQRLVSEFNTAQNDWARLNRQLSGSSSDARTKTLEDRRRIEAEREEALVKKNSAMKQIETIDEQFELMKVTAPHDGMITTWEVKKNLLDRPVEMGTELLAVANMNSRIVLEVLVKDDDMAPVLAAEERVRLETAQARQEGREPKESFIPAYFVTMTDPEHKYSGEVLQIASNSSQVEQDHAAKVTVGFDEAVRQDYLTKNKDFRPGAGVRVGIKCGHARLAYCLFRDVVHFWHESIMFRWPFLN